MATYEIINPSDHYTIIGEPCVVSACVLLLGEGRYATKRVEEGDAVELPIFIFGGDPVAWFKETFGSELSRFLLDRRDDLAACMASVLIGDRATFDLAASHMDVGAREKFRAEWHDKHRSSMNDIGKRAQRWSAKFREQVAA